MCISAAVSYGAAAVLLPTGLYALSLARRLHPPYWAFALTPFLFGIQQIFEGRVWQLLGAGEGAAAVPYALGFLFFSHFHWLWWIPLCSALVETGRLRRRLFLGIALFGALTGGLVYFAALLNPDWLSVMVRGDSVHYRIVSPLRGQYSLPFPASALYGLIILLPLLLSSHRHIRIFGLLIALSLVLASVAYGYAFVSVWCLFAALLSLYLVFMLRRLALATGR